MIARLIRWSIANRFLVLLATLMVSAWGVYSVLRTPLDALPDLSDVQVIIRTTYPGQAPRIVENQITYPLTTTMLSVPGAKTVRGYSFFGDSFVYVLFEDGTDMYWARSRVLEYLNQVQSKLPPGAKASLGPDATGVGWIYQYSLVDRSGTQDAGQLRALQDWFLKFELKTVPNVAEVASVGGMVRQYQILLDPDKLAAYGIPHTRVVEAIQRSNQEAGGSVLELGEAEYVVRASGYLQSLDDFRKVPLVSTAAGVSVRLADVARIQVGPEMRRGIGELDGEGEATGGVIVMRSGKNALETIAAVKEKLKSLQSSLPKGVEIVPVYDRSGLIERAVENLGHKLLEEFIVVAVVCFIFLFHLRSAFVAIVSLPLGILAAFIVMHYQGVNANIMSLGGIAIAIGAMVDAAVVMIENAHKHLERWSHDHPNEKRFTDRIETVTVDSVFAWLNRSGLGGSATFAQSGGTGTLTGAITVNAQGTGGGLAGPAGYTRSVGEAVRQVRCTTGPVASPTTMPPLAQLPGPPATMNIVVNEELKAYIEPLTPDEHDALERSILTEGCRDALVLWGDVLVDGHNRYGICQKHGLPFQTIQHPHFKSMEDVHLWMIDQHLGRRSVSDFQRGVLALRKREILHGRRLKAASAPETATPAAPTEAMPAVDSLKNRDDIAKAARLSSSQVVLIEKIQKQAAAEVVAAVKSGTISINAAAAVATLPADEQVAAALGEIGRAHV